MGGRVDLQCGADCKLSVVKAWQPEYLNVLYAVTIEAEAGHDP